MPRDKTESHKKIVDAAMQEFLEKGFEQASMKNVADAVGMTSAALYRHFESKQAMFAALVQPAVDALKEWTDSHVDLSYDALDQDDTDVMWNFDSTLNDAQMVLEVMYDQPEAFRLLLYRSVGTPFENFLHDMVDEATDQMMDFLDQCIAKKHPARCINRDEMHMLITAYISAMMQPLEHGYSKADAEQYLRTVQEFFTPGWRIILGL